MADTLRPGQQLKVNDRLIPEHGKMTWILHGSVLFLALMRQQSDPPIQMEESIPTAWTRCGSTPVIAPII